MKRFFTYFLTFAMLASSCLFAGCNKEGELTDEGFYDPNTDTYYVYCTPMKLYPNDPEKDEYLTVDNEDGTETVFYGVQFEDPKDFLCYEDSGYFFLAMNADLEEPSLEEFNPIAADIYNSNNLVYIDSFWADNEYLPDELKEHNPTEDTWLCQLIAESLADGENVVVPATEYDITDRYYLHMTSPDYPGLHYLVSFFGYNGRYFLRDSSANKTIVCPKEVAARLVG